MESAPGEVNHIWNFWEKERRWNASHSPLLISRFYLHLQPWRARMCGEWPCKTWGRTQDSPSPCLLSPRGPGTTGPRVQTAQYWGSKGQCWAQGSGASALCVGTTWLSFSGLRAGAEALGRSSEDFPQRHSLQGACWVHLAPALGRSEGRGHG